MKINEIYEIQLQNCKFNMPVLIKEIIDNDTLKVQLLVGPDINIYINKNQCINYLGKNKNFKIPINVKLNINQEFINDYNSWSNNNYGYGIQNLITDFTQLGISIFNINNFIICNKNKNNIYSICINENFKQLFIPSWLLIKYLVKQ